MSDLFDMPCECDSEPAERVRYFPRQLLSADDLRAEQEYLREKARRHNRYLHGWGVVCGCNVEVVAEATTPTVRVCPGYVVAPQGDDIQIDQCITVDLKTGAQEQPCSVRWPCPPEGEPPRPQNGRLKAYIAVRYAECYTRPVRVHPAGCGCDETGCEYSRIRDTFEIKVLWNLPASHEQARQDDRAWCEALNGDTSHQLLREHIYPVPPCPPCPSDPWVVLATVWISSGGKPTGSDNPTPLVTVSYLDRRVLLSTQRVQTAQLCLPQG
ncbi:hypothetical protein [Duganella sp. BuS-21]|uniref:hypothetical protein n=1 Tax=Duganella sp. BuS-21 TaxID=2943848 RepID=UPI0035A6F53A